MSNEQYDEVSNLFTTTLKEFLDVHFDRVKNLTIDEDDTDDMADQLITKVIKFDNTEIRFNFVITDNKWTRMLSIQILEDGLSHMWEQYKIGYNTTKEQLLGKVLSDFM